MCSQPIMSFVVMPFGGAFLYCAVDAFEMVVCTRFIALGQVMLDRVGLTVHLEAHWPGMDDSLVLGLLGELEAIAGANGADLAGHGFEHVLHDLPGGAPVSLFNELGHGEFARAVHSDQEIELALGRLHVCTAAISM
jgi:hypothetical protein